MALGRCLLTAGVIWEACESFGWDGACSDSEAGSYLRLVDFVCHSTLGLSVIKKKKTPDSKTIHYTINRLLDYKPSARL